MEAAEQAVERFLSIYTAVEKEVFIKQAVDGYHSRCVVKARNAGDAPKLCPGLSICHPAVYESLAL
jgi:hypothetical protein